MTDQPGIVVPEIEVDAAARTAAEALARAVREATADLPFGAETLDFLVARDALAPGEPE